MSKNCLLFRNSVLRRWDLIYRFDKKLSTGIYKKIKNFCIFFNFFCKYLITVILRLWSAPAVKARRLRWASSLRSYPLPNRRPQYRLNAASGLFLLRTSQSHVLGELLHFLIFLFLSGREEIRTRRLPEKTGRSMRRDFVGRWGWNCGTQAKRKSV